MRCFLWINAPHGLRKAKNILLIIIILCYAGRLLQSCKNRREFPTRKNYLTFLGEYAKNNQKAVEELGEIIVILLQKINEVTATAAWLKNKVYGKTSQSKKREKKNTPPSGDENPSGENNGNEGNKDPDPDGKKKEKKKKKQPKRADGCVDKKCENALKLVKDIYMTEEELNEKYGEGNWDPINSCYKTKEYKFIPARVVVVVPVLLFVFFGCFNRSLL